MYASGNTLNLLYEINIISKGFHLCQRPRCLAVTNSEIENLKGFIRGSRRPVNIPVILWLLSFLTDSVDPQVSTI